MAQAATALEGHDARRAIAAAQAASATAQQLVAALDRFSTLRAGIVQGRNDAERLVAQGYQMEASHAALNGARTALSDAAQALQNKGVSAAEPKLQAAQMMLDEAVANGTGLVALREENEQRIAAVEGRGQEAAAQIAAGRQAFDLVDEFAETTWSDIRGNGSEAQAAADRAHERWQHARQRNGMADQEFHEAKEDLDAVDRELATVQQLIEAITTRLKDLETARETAREIMGEAERSIAAGWQFVRANDPDVGRAPESSLREAETHLSAAQNEAKQAKPDWLKLVATAQSADQLADEALAGARSEAEAMAKLRQQAEQGRKLATAEVHKISQFVGLHRGDVQQTNLAAAATLAEALERANANEQRAAQLIEQQRRSVLEQAVNAYRAIQAESTGVYQRVYADFQRLEQRRAELNQELGKARNALGEAESLSSQLGRFGGDSRQRLRALRHSFDSIRLPISGEAELDRAIQLARRIASEAREISDALRRSVRSRGPDAGDVLTGMVIGQVLSGGSHHDSGGWGGGGGGGGGGWGGMGGSGGSFGGGGSGGSFGGGGSSGGGW